MIPADRIGKLSIGNRLRIAVGKRLVFPVALSLALAVTVQVFAGEPSPPIQACFTPDEDCTGQIVAEIDRARQSIFVQAYSFTSAPIAKALVEAKNRGVDVRTILDKS